MFLLGIGGALARIGREQPPRDLEPRGLGLALPDQTALAIALNFAELIAIDFGVEASARALAPSFAGKRRNEDENHDRGQTGKSDPKQHWRTNLEKSRRLAIGERGLGGKGGEREEEFGGKWRG